MTELIVQGGEDPAETAARREAWQAIVPDYAELRRGAYANAGDQLDTIWKWLEADGLVPDTSESRDLNTAAGMLGEVKAVKAAHPKL